MIEPEMVNVEAKTDEIAALVSKVKPILEGESNVNVLVTGLILALAAARPEVTEQELVDGVQATSEFILMFFQMKDSQGKKIISLN